MDFVFSNPPRYAPRFIHRCSVFFLSQKTSVYFDLLFPICFGSRCWRSGREPHGSPPHPLLRFLVLAVPPCSYFFHTVMVNQPSVFYPFPSLTPLVFLLFELPRCAENVVCSESFDALFSFFRLSLPSLWTPGSSLCFNHFPHKTCSSPQPFPRDSFHSLFRVRFDFSTPFSSHNFFPPLPTLRSLLRTRTIIISSCLLVCASVKLKQPPPAVVFQICPVRLFVVSPPFSSKCGTISCCVGPPYCPPSLFWLPIVWHIIAFPSPLFFGVRFLRPNLFPCLQETKC